MTARGDTEWKLKIARVAVRGVTLLFWGKVIGYAGGAVGAILVARLLTPSEYGLISVAMVVPGVLGLFGGWGLGEAITKHIAEYKARGEYKNIGDIVGTGAFFMILTGVTLALVGYFTASYFTINVFHKEDALPLARLASILLFTGSLYGFVQVTFFGFERMEYNSLLMMFERIFQTALMPLLIIVGLGVFGAMMGFVVAALLTCLISILILSKFLRSRHRNWRIVWKPNIEVFSQMIRYGIPLAMATLILSVLSRYGDVLVSTFCTTDEIGNFTVALKLSVLWDMIISPVTVTLFPTFSKLDLNEERETLEKTFEYSVKYSSLFMVPVAMGTLVLAKPATHLFFGPQYESAWLYLALMAIGWLYVGFGLEPLTLLFMGQGETKLVTKMRLITALTGAPLTYLLVVRYGIVGSMISGLVMTWPTYVYAIKNSQVRYDIGTPVKRTIGIYVASIVAMIPVATLIMLTNLNHLGKLLMGGAIGVSLYLIMLPRTGGINQEDIRVLMETLGTLPYIGKLAKSILAAEEKML